MVAAQPNAWQPDAPPNYRFLIQQADSITGSAGLQPVFNKLRRLQQTDKGVVRIVHIGDSHTQADIMTGVVRRGLQTAFGNAGRGLVFPYHVARSNAPVDIVSSSLSGSWQSNRLALSRIPILCGLSGFGIHSNSARAAFRIGLKQDSSWDNAFDRVRIFLKDAPGCYEATLPDGTLLTGLTKEGADTPSITFRLKQPVHELTLTRCESDTPLGPMSFYGISLEKQNVPGILYHTIGVNGATYSQYNGTPLFWQQLPGLRADCYILSLGTNEAQAKFLDKGAFIAECRTMVNNLRKASPGAVILITTPAGSHRKGGKPNTTLQQVRDALAAFCEEERIPMWDLYRMTGGFRTAPQWKRAGLMSHDGIHYNSKGYTLQGNLLIYALARAYEGF